MVYNHKSAKAIEHMIVDALLAAEPVLEFVRHINDPRKFLQLTDHLMSYILWLDKPVGSCPTLHFTFDYVCLGIGGVSDHIQSNPGARFIQIS
jgi:hypothetical protein